MYRLLLRGDEVRLMQIAMTNIFDAMIEYLGLSSKFRGVLKLEIYNYGSSLQISKSRHYRQIYDYHPTTSFFYIILLHQYIILMLR
ncbi:hypothetical protein F4782DRAFT_490083 [Xylaria castorea]|nr:hypothetical protein F4782DRAFT_490083 [Xylaria castorea]